MKKILSIVLCLALVTITSCDAFLAEELKYEVRLNQNKITMFVGETVEVSGSVYRNSELVESPQLIWESSNPLVATVQEGHIKAVGLGQVKVTAKYENAQNDIIVDCVGEITSENANSFDEKYINIFGRHYMVDGGLKLDQTANAIEVGIIGTSLSIELTSDRTSYMQVYVDGENAGRLEISGSGTYNVADGLDDGYHVIRIVKDTEMRNAEWTLHSFDAVKFASVPEKSELKIEFIGDSLSAGYGNLGSRGEAWSLKNSSAIEAYPYKTAALLGADYSVIAWSGICTKVYMWSDINMSTLYGWNSFSNREAYDFADEPDVIVINLGTNEANYIYDGHKEYNSEKMFEDYLEFLNGIRRKNPNAHIICIYGIAGEHPAIKEGIEMAVALMDDKVVFNPFEFVPNGSGAVGHPTAEANTAWAASLAKYIEGLNIN
jgi:lysophospholipase L1-like esterase